MVKQDHVMPKNKWEFDAEVTDVFEDMLRRSIPQYDVMRESVFEIGDQFVKRGTVILDLGCSRGDALAPFVEKYEKFCIYHGCEMSEPMIDLARERFKDNPNVRIQRLDLRTDFPPLVPSLVLSVLTMMFIPLEYRQQVIRTIHDSLVKGGAFIMVEKILGGTSEINNAFVNRYYNMKRVHGYSDVEIERKRLSLEGVLVPVTASWNEELLRTAGFRYLDCFWRWMNFAGWVAVKG